MSLLHACENVEDFHKVMGLPILDKPQFPSDIRVALRRDLILEEVTETIEAISQRDMVETADGLADIIYVCIGAALEFGIPLNDVWLEVQRSNMAKVDPATGVVHKREDGKILKPEGWTPPDIARILAEASK